MNVIQTLLTEHIDIWTAADTEKKSDRGRSAGNAASVYGIRKLRELILELAVRGKLVPQDPNDEPAAELLKRIQAEKTKLIAEGKIKKEKPLLPITDEEKPFDLPQGWDWVRLSQISEANTGYAFKSSEYISKGTLVLRVTNINPDGTLDLTDAKYIDPNTANSTYRGFQLSEGDILLVMVGGSLGKLGVVDENCLPAVLNQNMWKMVRFGGIAKDYFLLGLRQINSSQIEITNSTHGHLAQGEYLSKLFSLPPLAEQHRIVAKVDELMALCDQLETQHNNAAEAHEKLVSHLLATLTQSQNAADLSTNWQRIAAHFDTLFTTEASIDALKQTLLQLAVMGKLVPQDPKDEPASELLKRIQAEKAKLIAEGKIKKEKPLPLITEQENPFVLPKGWEWVRLGDLVEKSGAGWGPSCEGHPRTGNDWGVLKVSAVSWGKFQPDENKALPKSLDARLDCVVESGDFLVSRANTAELVARSVVVEDCPPNLMLSDKIVRLRLSSLCDKQFINTANTSSYAREYYSVIAGGTSSSMKNVSREQILNLLFGMPPLAEQRRIVAKVDELMALCEQLKSRITAANQLQQKLADVLVEQAVV